MDFVTVTHPDLPGQLVRMVRPRNGWSPVEESLRDVTIPELREAAQTRGVDLTGLTRKADIVSALSASVDAEATPPNSPSPNPAEEDGPATGKSTSK